MLTYDAVIMPVNCAKSDILDKGETVNTSFRNLIVGFVSNPEAIRVFTLVITLAVALAQPMGPVAGGGGA